MDSDWVHVRKLVSDWEAEELEPINVKSRVGSWVQVWHSAVLQLLVNLKVSGQPTSPSIYQSMATIINDI